MRPLEQAIAHPHLISFVIPAWNEESVLGPTLEAVSVATQHLAESSEVSFLFSTRKAFEAVGGFDTALYATEEVTISLALHRQGRFVCLRECVSTSGRKLRTHSTVEWFVQLYRITFARNRYIRDRSAMGVWYGGRRPDPELTNP